MIIYNSNIEDIIRDFGIKEDKLLRSLQEEVEQFNANPLVPATIGIGIQDWHDDCDEYPDYYGTFRVFILKNGEWEPLGLEENIHGLDTALCTLTSYFDELLEMERTNG